MTMWPQNCCHETAPEQRLEFLHHHSDGSPDLKIAALAPECESGSFPNPNQNPNDALLLHTPLIDEGSITAPTSQVLKFVHHQPSVFNSAEPCISDHFSIFNLIQFAFFRYFQISAGCIVIVPLLSNFKAGGRRLGPQHIGRREATAAARLGKNEYINQL